MRVARLHVAAALLGVAGVRAVLHEYVIGRELAGQAPGIAAAAGRTAIGLRAVGQEDMVSVATSRGIHVDAGRVVVCARAAIRVREAQLIEGQPVLNLTSPNAVVVRARRMVDERDVLEEK